MTWGKIFIQDFV